jgi:hypothetical protein
LPWQGINSAPQNGTAFEMLKFGPVVSQCASFLIFDAPHFGRKWHVSEIAGPARNIRF